MTGDLHTQARLQRIEDRVASLDETVAVLALVDDGAAKRRISETFAEDLSMVIIYRACQKGLSQSATAKELRQRGLQRADQGAVSRACAELEERGFLKKRKLGGYGIQEGWQAFKIDNALKAILRRHGVTDLG